MTVDDDNDHDHEKRARQTKEQAGYDGPDDEDRDIMRQQDEEEARELDPSTELRLSGRAEDGDTLDIAEEKFGKIDFHDMQERNPSLTKFTFDKVNGQWCEIELAVFQIM